VLLIVAASAVALPRADACAQSPLVGLNPAQWRLIWTVDPAHRATMSWTTAEQSRSNRVHLKEAQHEPEQIVECRSSGRYSPGLGRIELYYHHALLDHLLPSTRYELTLESDGQSSAKFYFITAPVDDRPVSIMFGGDSRSDAKKRRGVNSMLAKLLAQQPEILALAHGGDYVGSGTQLAEWSEWMSDYELTTATDGRLLPIVPARGNHDGGPLFNEIFGFPAADTNYYLTELGTQVRLVTLNTETSIAGSQLQWLDQTLKSSRPQCRYLVAQYHRPAYPAVKSPSAALQYWVPLFDRYNLDLACEADGHNIKRTVPIRDNMEDATGVVYIGEGGLGVQQRTPKLERWFLRPPGMGASGHHVHVLSFNPSRLESKVILLGEKVLDTYSRRPRAGAGPPAKLPMQSAAKG